MQPKNVALVGAVCITIGWLLASVLTPPVARVQSRPRADERAVPQSEAVPFDEPLRLRLRQMPVQPAGQRNPFVFATRGPEAAPGDDRADTAAVSSVAAAPLPVRSTPRFQLSGIGITGDIRTAILTIGDDVRIVTVGDVIDGFTVAEITDSSVTLVGETDRLTLRFAQ